MRRQDNWQRERERQAVTRKVVSHVSGMREDRSFQDLEFAFKGLCFIVYLFVVPLKQRDNN
jgi:hypothetical protein